MVNLLMTLKSYAKRILDSNNHKSYLRWYVHNTVFNNVDWCGIKSQKLVTLILECGARNGGSTLFF